jgi:hypothetical protein
MRTGIRKITLATAALWPLLAVNASGADRNENEEAVTGISVQLDNDLFAGREDDRDYTGGLAVTFSGRRARDNVLSLDPLLSALDRAVGTAASQYEFAIERHAQQIGIMAFTPADITASEPLHDDRPYASMIYVSNGRVRVDADQRGAWTSSLTIGILGLPLTEQLHNGVHKLVGSERPRGYDYQISNGGEPTARYSLARHRLWIANPSATLDVKTTVQGSVGYLTEGSAAISIRAGRFSTPWWSFAPELTDYAPAPVPVESTSHSRRDLYAFAGARLKARAYNAFLQGQFRHSEVRYSASEVEPLLVHAWLGVVTQIFEQTNLSYTLNYQTAEVREGRAARDSLWAAVHVSHSF